MKQNSTIEAQFPRCTIITPGNVLCSMRTWAGRLGYAAVTTGHRQYTFNALKNV